MNTLYAKEGSYLTQKTLAEGETRIITTSVMGVRATRKYWRNATAEEIKQFNAEHPQTTI